MAGMNKGAITTSDIVKYGVLAAILIVSKELLAWLPNIELVTCLLMVYTVELGAKAFYPAYVFVLVEILLYGFGIWSFTYLYIWAVLIVVILIVRKTDEIADNLVIMAVIGGIYGLTFGTLSSLVTLVIAGRAAAWAYIVSGLYYDIGHCVGNVLTVLVLYKPMRKLLVKILLRTA